MEAENHQHEEKVVMVDREQALANATSVVSQLAKSSQEEALRYLSASPAILQSVINATHDSVQASTLMDVLTTILSNGTKNFAVRSGAGKNVDAIRNICVFLWWNMNVIFIHHF